MKTKSININNICLYICIKIECSSYVNTLRASEDRRPLMVKKKVYILKVSLVFSPDNIMCRDRKIFETKNHT